MPNDKPLTGKVIRKVPVDFSQEVCDRICDELLNGDSLSTICAAEDMPSIGAVLRWLMDADPKYKAFYTQYRKARMLQAELRVDEIMDIADNNLQDWVRRVKTDEESGEESVEYLFDHFHVQRCRLMIDSRKWYAAKAMPKLYGVAAEKNAEDLEETDRSVVFRMDLSKRRLRRGEQRYEKPEPDEDAPDEESTTTAD